MNKLIKYTHIKGKNFRITIILDYTDENNKSFILTTKRLINFKKRQITEVNNIFSVETFLYLNSAINHLLENSEVKNKILLSDFHKLESLKSKPQMSSNLEK